MSPKPARIHLAQSALVFSAERDGKGKGQAGVRAAGLEAQGMREDGRGVPATDTRAALHLSPATASGSPSLPPHTPSSSPSPLHHFCFIYEYVAGIQMSYLFCGRLTFPQRASACLTQGPAETAREEKERAKEFFSALFIPLPPPQPRPPPYFILCVCVCVGRTLHCHAPLAPLLPAFIPLALL